MKTTTQESTEDFLMSQLEICKTKQDLMLAFWFYWVESVTLTDREFQKVCANSAVNKWFLIELSKYESEFKTLIASYPDTHGRDKDWLYCKCVSKLMSRFPQALLQSAKKRELKPQITKVAGIKIEFNLTNLN
jgi:hypothetical protein